ncbi:hypothetical protein FRC06_003788 [Ceratobasidium sp. 370]|nr:hypothetical protein FRC06_003788 [Ceratobasidium sp. 370]
MAERPNHYEIQEDVPIAARYLPNPHPGVNTDDEGPQEGEEFIPQDTQAQDTNSESPKALSNIVAILSSYGCLDASELLDLSVCGDRPVAFGGFGDIYYGKTKDGMPVAIKCARVNVGEITEYGTLKAVANELNAWSKCKHENVVELIGLAQFREQIQMSIDMNWRCVQITAGLAYLHENNMVHGDVKGWNVLVSEDGVAKLTDLGSTRLKDASLQFTSGASATALSLRWAAPELLGGLSSYSAEADVYALGMASIPTHSSFFTMLTKLQTILEVMTGKVPYEGQTDFAVCGKVLTKRTFPPRPSDGVFAQDFKGDLIWLREAKYIPYHQTVKVIMRPAGTFGSLSVRRYPFHFLYDHTS